MVRRKSRSELELAEIRLQSLRERRDASSAGAAAARQERDLLHAERKRLMVAARDLRGRRADLVRERQVHRSERDRLQAEARRLIELKRTSRGRLQASPAADLERLRAKARGLEMRQQTASLSLPEENRLLEELKVTLRAARELESLRAEEEVAVENIRDLDVAIDDRFRRAEAEHRLVVSLGAQADVVRAELQTLLPQIETIGAEADKKHQEFLAFRAKADDLHAKAVEMRDRIITIRGERRSEAREAREAIRQHALEVQQALSEGRKLDEAADKAVQTLLRGGRVEIKG